MTDSTKCPVCGRNDIPDYNKGEVRCPDCGSDLKVFRLLNEIEAGGSVGASKWKPLAIFALIAAAAFALLYLTKDSSASASEAKDRITLLEDSINSLNEKLNASVEVVSNTDGEKTDAGKEDVKTAESKDGEAEKAQADNAENITAPADKVVVKDGKKYYVVKKGDTWWGISKKLYKGKVKDEEIAKMNGKKTTDQLEIDQEILVK